MADWQGIPDAYLYTGGAGIVGRLMFHAQQVQRGRRKPLSWALTLDLPIALGMGWLAYGVGVWLKMASEPTVSSPSLPATSGPTRWTGSLPRWLTVTRGASNPPSHRRLECPL
jgi:hypothetical protein